MYHLTLSVSSLMSDSLYKTPEVKKNTEKCLQMPTEMTIQNVMREYVYKCDNKNKSIFYLIYCKIKKAIETM